MSKKIAAVFTAISGGYLVLIAMMIGVLLLALFLIKILWAWTISDLFLGAFEQGSQAQYLG